ncbi:MAG: hypothetical protein Q7R47_04465 [Candidatus Diapherotrites archaeon]|nr:hypothetical protein [Candidatus Diapherotrites archaeon]
MEVLFSPKAQKSLDEMDATLRKLFLGHAEKIASNPNQRHMRFGLPFFVEEVTRSARLAYHIESETLFVVRCFATHKEYEKWYKSFK